MKNRLAKSIISSVLIASTTMAMAMAAPIETLAADGFFMTAPDPIVICLDPGHGGSADGAKYEHHGQMIYEKDLNWTIASYLKEELLTYQNVEIIMVRDGDTDIENQERADFAALNGADYYISIHNNAKDKQIDITRGCMVLCPVGTFQYSTEICPNIYGSTDLLAKCVMKNLCALGLEVSPDFPELSTNGIVRRPYSPDGGAKQTREYPDGTVADYYSQIRFTEEYGIPAIVIEHAYISNDADYDEYLSTDDKLKELAMADAAAIAEAWHLVKY